MTEPFQRAMLVVGGFLVYMKEKDVAGGYRLSVKLGGCNGK